MTVLNLTYRCDARQHRRAEVGGRRSAIIAKAASKGRRVEKAGATNVDNGGCGGIGGRQPAAAKQPLFLLFFRSASGHQHERRRGVPHRSLCERDERQRAGE